MPPAFSAKKIGGTPAYKMARAGKPVELKPVAIHIRSLEITALEGEQATFLDECQRRRICALRRS